MTRPQRIIVSAQRSIEQAGVELLSLFLCFSFVMVSSFGGVLGLLHQDGLFVLARVRLPLYLLTWTAIPALALIAVIGFARMRPEHHARQTFSVFSAYFILFSIATLAYFGTLITFPRLLLILCGVYWVVALGVALVPSFYTTQAVVLGGVLTLAALWSGSQVPIVIQEEIRGGSVNFVVQPGVMLLPSDQATLSWDTSNIQAIYINDEPTIGTLTLDQIAPGTTQLLRIQFADTEIRNTAFDIVQEELDYRFDFKFPSPVLYALWLVLGLCMVVSGGAVGYKPGLAGPLAGGALFVAMFYFLNAPAWFPSSLLLWILPGGLGVYLVWRLERVFTARWVLVGSYAVLIALASTSVISTDFAVETFHSTSQYIGTVTDAMGGHIPIVDSIAYYGILQTYVLVVWFQAGLFPPSMASFAFFIMLSVIAQLGVLYWIAWRLTRVHTLVWAMIFLVINISLYNTWANPLTLVSVGPIRYFPQYIIILLVTLRLQGNTQIQQVPPREYIVLALVFLSELPVVILTVAAYISISILEALLLTSDWRVTIRLVLIRIGATLLVGAVVWGGFLLFSWARTGGLPALSNYVATYFDDFASRSFLRQFPTFYPWIFYSVALYGTLAYVAFYGLTHRTAASVAVPLFAIAIFGVVQNIYWIQERWISGIGGIQNVACPALLYAYWLNRLWQSDTNKLLKALSYGVVGTLVVTLVYWSLQPNTTINPGQSLARSVLRGLTSTEETLAEATNVRQLTQTHYVPSIYTTRQDGIFMDTVYLVEKYEPDSRRVAVFLEGSMTYEVLLSLGRSHIYPVSHPWHWYVAELFDPLYPERRDQLIQTYSADLTTDDYVFFRPDDLEAGSIWADILAYLETAHKFEYVEYSPHGIVAARLR